MRRLLVVLTVLAWSLPAHAQSSTEMSIVIGKSEPVKLDGPISVGTCDDTSIVQIDTSDGVKLKGLKLGSTQCGFWTMGGNHHWLVSVTVIEPPEDSAPPKPRDDPHGGERKDMPKQ